MRWYSLSVSVCAGATVIESPVCTPIGSKFSIEQTMMQLLRSRTTSISNSYRQHRLLEQQLARREASTRAARSLRIPRGCRRCRRREQGGPDHDRVADAALDRECLFEAARSASAAPRARSRRMALRSARDPRPCRSPRARPRSVRRCTARARPRAPGPEPCCSTRSARPWSAAVHRTVSRSMMRATVRHIDRCCGPHRRSRGRS